MPIDPRIEAPLRKMLGHAMRGELDDLYALILEVGDQTYEAAIILAIKAGGYITTHVSERWPNDADIREIAKHAVKTRIGQQVTEDEIRDYLSRVVLGTEAALNVFPDNKRAAMVPLFTTAALLSGYGPKDTDQWGYLDQIWNALDAAETIDSSLPPAVVYLYGKAYQQ
jgi:hypothetical protein